MPNFNGDTDVNYQAYVNALKNLHGRTSDDFKEFLIKYLALQATNSVTFNNAAFATALTKALLAAKTGNYNF